MEESSFDAAHTTPRDSLVRWYHIPLITRAESLLRTFSPFERLLLYVFAVTLALSTAWILVSLNTATTVTVPAHGGSLTEGIVGTPRFINPLLAISDADRDLTSLIYSGLLRPMPDGSLIPDLASRYEISEDGRTYTFFLREDATFHDGASVTADDISFTVTTAQNPAIKSPKRADWDGVTTEIIDAHTVRFTLPSPYAPFLENATLGILPVHIWQDVAPEEFPFYERNTRPIGSGPYRIRDVRFADSGAPDRYRLRSFSQFSLGAPYLNNLTLLFYTNKELLTEAFVRGAVDTAGGLGPTTTPPSDAFRVEEATLPRVFAIFLNHNQASFLSDENLRRALDVAIDKEALIEKTLGGGAVALDGPIPPNVLAPLARSEDTPPENVMTSAERQEKARSLLESAGWEFDEEEGAWYDDGTVLSFAVKTADTPDLVAVAESVAETWRTIGIDVQVEVFSTSDLNTSVIRPRQYEALLFGEIVGRSLDLFAFWHSSQRADPGLNLASYTNADTDALLSRARAETDREEREASYREFAKIVSDEAPAIFLFAPEYRYILPAHIEGVSLGALTTPAERFMTVHQWHRETERVWSIFIDQ